MILFNYRRLNHWYIFVISIYLVGYLTPELRAQDKNAPGNANIHLADPTIFYHGGVYYLYGTVEGNSNQGFLVYTSSDLKKWEGPKGVHAGFALRKEDVFGDKGFWAPQVFYYNHQFYLAYTANEQIAIATSNSPLGPFTQVQKAALPAPGKQIDPYVFIDDDGKKYLYHVRLTNGNRLFVAELKDDFTDIKTETLRECVAATEPWENTASSSWPVAEGPSVLKHKNQYYFVYSANDFRNPDYAVGYALSNHPLGPWQKYTGNPIISKKELGINGVGHGDFVKNKQGKLYYVLHTHFAANKVTPRKTAIIRVKFGKNRSEKLDKLVIDAKSLYYPQLQTKPVNAVSE